MKIKEKKNTLRLKEEPILKTRHDAIMWPIWPIKNIKLSRDRRPKTQAMFRDKIYKLKKYANINQKEYY